MVSKVEVCSGGFDPAAAGVVVEVAGVVVVVAVAAAADVDEEVEDEGEMSQPPLVSMAQALEMDSP